MSTVQSSGLRAVIFDAFGTLVRIGQRRKPYRQLQALLAAHGRRPQPTDAQVILTTNLGLAGYAAAAGLSELPEDFAGIERDLYEELSTIELFDDVLPTISALRRQGLKIGLCSNLATPYAIPVRVLLPRLDAYAWSFEVGAVKPDPVIYAHVLAALGMPADRTLFVGDTPEADFDGPRRAGMRSVLIDRDGSRGRSDAIRELTKVVEWIDADLQR